MPSRRSAQPGRRPSYSVVFERAVGFTPWCLNEEIDSRTRGARRGKSVVPSRASQIEIV